MEGHRPPAIRWAAEEEGARPRGVPPSTQAAEPHPCDRTHRHRGRRRRPDLPGRPGRPREAVEGGGQGQGRQALRGGRDATEKYNGAKERQEKLNKEVSNLQDSVARGQADLNEHARRSRFDGHRPVPQRRHRPVRAAVPLRRPGQLPRQGLHAGPAELQADRGAEEDPGQAARPWPRSARRPRASSRTSPRPAPSWARRRSKSRASSPRPRACSTPSPPRSRPPSRPGARAPTATPANAWTSATRSPPRSAPPPRSPPPGQDRLPVRLRRHRPELLRLLRADLLGVRAGRRVDPAHLGGAVRRRHPDRPRALQPGDLVFFYSDLHHVGLYAGNGQILHAPNRARCPLRVDEQHGPFQFGVRV